MTATSSTPATSHHTPAPISQAASALKNPTAPRTGTTPERRARPPPATAAQRGAQRAQKAARRQEWLHRGGPFVARAPLREGRGGVDLLSGRLLRQIDVDGGAGEQTRRQGGNYFQ